MLLLPLTSHTHPSGCFLFLLPDSAYRIRNDVPGKICQMVIFICCNNIRLFGIFLKHQKNTKYTFRKRNFLSLGFFPHQNIQSFRFRVGRSSQIYAWDGRIMMICNLKGKRSSILVRFIAIKQTTYYFLQRGVLQNMKEVVHVVFAESRSSSQFLFQLQSNI